MSQSELQVRVSGRNTEDPENGEGDPEMTEVVGEVCNRT
jgi:hypothetical protein